MTNHLTQIGFVQAAARVARKSSVWTAELLSGRTEGMAHPLAVEKYLAEIGDTLEHLRLRAGLAAPESTPASPPGCAHVGYRFEKHGRCCPDCGEFLVDMGD